MITVFLWLESAAVALTGVATRPVAAPPTAYATAASHVGPAESLARAGLTETTASAGEAEQIGRLDAGVALNLRSDSGERKVSPLVIGGLMAMLLVALSDRARRRADFQAPVTIDHDFEALAPIVVASTPARAAFRDPAPDKAAEPDPLRHFHPDAPPVKTAPNERSRPDYIRVDDATEVWTPARVEAERAPTDAAAPARRRRTDAPGADYRFHRLNRDGSVKTAERRKFVTDLDAHRFAETLGRGDAVEVWLGERRLATIPPDYFS